MSLMLRPATPEDIDPIQSIYAHEVLHGTASFELQPPDHQTMHERFAALIATNHPYLVATIAGRVAGYAYAAAYRPRIAYRWTVENSVYIADWARRQGVGQALLQALIERSTAAGFRQMIAVIGDSANIASIELHRAAGFRLIGTERAVGFKFGRWLDTVHMQIALGLGDAAPPSD